MSRVPTVEEALATEFTEPELDYIRHRQSLLLEGSPTRVKQGLIEVAEHYKADELIVAGITHDYPDRAQSYELLAEAFDITSETPVDDG